MKLMKDKKGVADINEPQFWFISVGLWIIVVILTWKASMGSDVDVTKLKIMFSVISGPIIIGLCYVMGQNG